MTDRPRVLFMGTPGFAAPILRALLEAQDRFHVVGLVSQPDRPAGRGRTLSPTPTKVVAEEFSIPVFQPTKVKTEETRATLAKTAPDVAVVAAYGRILPPQLLELPRHGCINVHASILPEHRGASPIAHAILAGDALTGVSLMQMDEGLDTGPVFAKATLEIKSTDTTETLTQRLAAVGANFAVDQLPAILEGGLQSIPQIEAGATYAPLLKKTDGVLDFTEPAEVLERKVRAFQPWPMASFALGDKRVQVGSAAVSDEGGEAGRVLETSKLGVRVGCGAGSLWLVEVKPPGKRMMPASAWVSGRGVAAGDRVGG